jgi:hypothetical protein
MQAVDTLVRVQVTSLTPQFETSDAAVGQVIDQKQVAE